MEGDIDYDSVSLQWVHLANFKLLSFTHYFTYPVCVHVHSLVEWGGSTCSDTGGGILVQAGSDRCTTVYFSFLHQAAVLRLQNTGQLTCSHTSTPESICKSLSSWYCITGGQPSLEHLQKLVSGVLETVF